jgi:hypothetical protein
MPAKLPLHGTAPTKLSPNMSKAISSFAATMPAYVTTGKRKAVAEATGTTIVTIVLDAGMPTTAPRTVLKRRKLKVLTPYRPDTWESLLCKAGLFATYHWIPDGLCYDFHLELPQIKRTQIPPNKDSIIVYSEPVNTITKDKLFKARYIGPFSQGELKDAISPFQSSPLSVIPKSTPGKYRILQNYSFPYNTNTLYPNPSINSFINSGDFPTTWGTFTLVSLLIS